MVFQKHLLQDEALENVLHQTQQILLEELDRYFTNNNNDDDDDWKECSLFEFVSLVVFRASAGPLLSKKLNENAAENLKQLRTFEQGLGPLFIGVPPSWVPSAAKARSYLVDLLDSKDIKETESPFLQERRRRLTNRFQHAEEFKGAVDKTVASNNVGILLATVGNSIQAIFWTLLNLMEDADAYAACRAAVQTVAAKREAGREWFTLEELDSLPLLRSAFEETLRMYQSLFITRQATEDFILNPKATDRPQYMVKKDTLIMALPNSMHMDPTIFENPTQFQYDRFVDPNATSKLGTKLSTHLRPFGGGAHLCPGRKFIGYESRALLAMLLLRYDLRYVPGESRPSIDLSRQGMSVSVPERDVKMQIRLHE